MSPSQSRNTFPKCTLVGAGIGGTLFVGMAVVAGAGRNLLPDTRSRLWFAGLIGGGGLVGLAFDTDQVRGAADAVPMRPFHRGTP